MRTWSAAAGLGSGTSLALSSAPKEVWTPMDWVESTLGSCECCGMKMPLRSPGVRWVSGLGRTWIQVWDGHEQRYTLVPRWQRRQLGKAGAGRWLLTSPVAAPLGVGVGPSSPSLSCRSWRTGARRRARSAVRVSPGATDRGNHLLPVATQLDDRSGRGRDQGVNAGDAAVPPLHVLEQCREQVWCHGYAAQRRRPVGQQPGPAVHGRPHQVVRAGDGLVQAVADSLGRPAVHEGGDGVEPVHHLHPARAYAWCPAADGHQPAAVTGAGLRPSRRGAPPDSADDPGSRGNRAPDDDQRIVAAQQRHPAGRRLLVTAAEAPLRLHRAAGADRLRH